MSGADFLSLAAPGIDRLRPYVPGKPMEELERELGLSETLKLASNENPLGPSPLGLEAARASLDGINLYPDDNGFRLKNRLSARLGVAPERIILGAGSSDVIDMVARTFLAPGRNAVFSPVQFRHVPHLHHRRRGRGAGGAGPATGPPGDALRPRPGGDARPGG